MFTKKASKEFLKLDKNAQKLIKSAIKERLEKDPEKYLKRLVSDKKEFYKFRVSSYRLICHKNNEGILILILKVGHRKDIYR